MMWIFFHGIWCIILWVLWARRVLASDGVSFHGVLAIIISYDSVGLHLLSIILELLGVEYLDVPERKLGSKVNGSVGYTPNIHHLLIHCINC